MLERSRRDAETYVLDSTWMDPTLSCRVVSNSDYSRVGSPALRACDGACERVITRLSLVEP